MCVQNTCVVWSLKGINTKSDSINIIFGCLMHILEINNRFECFKSTSYPLVNGSIAFAVVFVVWNHQALFCFGFSNTQNIHLHWEKHGFITAKMQIICDCIHMFYFKMISPQNLFCTKYRSFPLIFLYRSRCTHTFAKRKRNFVNKLNHSDRNFITAFSDFGRYGF